MSKKVLVLLADGFEEIEALTPIDVLRRAGADVTSAATLGESRVKGAHGIFCLADSLLENLRPEGWDCIVLPGGMPGAKNLGSSNAVCSFVQATAQAGGHVAAICAAPVMTLNAWGMLHGRKATCYPGMESMFASDVHFCPDRVVQDGNITTSRGPGTALEFALHLVSVLFGVDAKATIKEQMLAL